MSSVMFTRRIDLIEGPQIFVQSLDRRGCQVSGCGITLRCYRSFAPGARPAPQSFETGTRLQEYPSDRIVAVKADEIILRR